MLRGAAERTNAALIAAAAGVGHPEAISSKMVLNRRKRGSHG
jgi:hypothetical protein